MILGLSFSVFVHVVISLIGIVSGLAVLYGLLTAQRMDSLTAVFLSSTALTSITGFLLPAAHLMPSHILGIASLIDLAIAIPARYRFHMTGHWRGTYVISAGIALYFNMFVLVVQLFEKVAALKALAPTQSEPPFAIAQLTLLVAFLALTVFAVRRFRPEQLRAA